jgi:predicted site-specific integrase-resolvase
MKLSAWAKQQGLSYKTAWRMWKAGTLPLPAEQLATGTVIVQSPNIDTKVVTGAALYADRQLARLSEFAASQKFHVIDAVREIGSGLIRCAQDYMENGLLKTVLKKHWML